MFQCIARLKPKKRNNARKSFRNGRVVGINPEPEGERKQLGLLTFAGDEDEDD